MGLVDLIMKNNFFSHSTIYRGDDLHRFHVPPVPVESVPEREKLAANNGSTFVKSRHIADEFDVSAKRIGIALAALEDDPSTPFSMDRRGGNSNGTTWYIETPRASKPES